MQEKEISNYNIALAIGPDCTKQINVILYSVFYNNPHLLFTCYFLYFDLPNEELNFYKRIVAELGYKCVFLQFPQINIDRTEYRHVTNETFLRLLIPSALPKNVKRVLYLDYDVIVNGSLKEVFHYSFGQYSLLAAVANKNQNKLNAVKQANGVPYGKKYFNAGVLVMDLDKLRENESFKKDYVLYFLEHHLKEIKEDDQGYLNHYLWNKTKIINYKYNYNAAIYYLDGHDAFSRIKSATELIKAEKKAEEQAIIIHYRGASKPWDQKYYGQCGKLYSYYARKAGYSIKVSKQITYKMLKFMNIVSLIIKK